MHVINDNETIFITEFMFFNYFERSVHEKKREKKKQK